MQQMTSGIYTVAGMMSGTSLDGMDLVLCRFEQVKGKWQFHIQKAQTIEYPEFWREKLINARNLDVEDFIMLHNRYGVYIGEQLLSFLEGTGMHVDLVASHGHTIFHQPGRNLTFQLGSGASIAATCRIPVVSDFRVTDMALGGQGAPLVPAGDELLFGEYAFCLNLGGIANISYVKNGIRVAFDVCPVNMVANYLAFREGQEFDRDGILGKSGRINHKLVDELNHLAYYQETGPGSLGREWVESEFLPVLSGYDLPAKDLLRSVYEHIATRTAKAINSGNSGNVLVTGGGAFNTFLVELIQEKSTSILVVPEETIVKFKEAIIFALLGLLRMQNKTNCFASVTGAKADSSCGSIFLSGI